MSTFSGISAASVAWKPLGWQFVAYAEPAAFQSHVLAQRCGAGRPRYLPEGKDFDPKKYRTIPEEGVVNWGDLTRITDEDLESLGPVDLLEGGSPCQSFSFAGLRGGLSDDRGNLALEFVKLAQRMRRINGLKYVVYENVCGILQHRDNPFGCLLGAFAGEDAPLEPPGKGWTHAGHVRGPEAHIAWRVLDAQFFGLAQRRKRVFALVCLGDRPDVDPEAVLFERCGEGRSFEACGEAGQEGAAGPAEGAVELTPAAVHPWQQSGGTGGVQGVGSGVGDDGDPMFTITKSGQPHGVIYEDAEIYPLQNSGNLGAQEGDGVGVPGEPMFTLTAHGKIHGVAHEVVSIQSPGGQPNMNGCGYADGPMFTLTANDRHGVVHPLQNGGCRGEEVSLGFGEDGDPMYTLTAHGRPHGVVYPEAAVHPPVVGTLMACGAGLDRVASAGNEQDFVIVHPDEGGTIGTLMTTSGASRQIDIEHLLVHLGVDMPEDDGVRYVARRLLPVEAERLQGFPDGFTDVLFQGRPAKDSHRYRALGNSMATKCLLLIGRRLQSSVVALP